MLRENIESYVMLDEHDQITMSGQEMTTQDGECVKKVVKLSNKMLLHK